MTPDPAASRGRGAGWGPIPVQLLFATAAHSVVILDFVLERHLVLSDGAWADAGQPFSLTFVLTEDTEPTCTMSTLKQWCDTGDLILASSELVRDRPSLILRHRDTVVDLELC